MSVYKRAGAGTYSYDFRWRGHRFSGSTGEADKRRAREYEKKVREQVKTRSIDRSKPMSFADASSLYWTEKGQFHRNAVDIRRAIGWLQTHIGMRVPLSVVTDAKVAELVAIRRKEGVSNATVNRSVTEPLRAIMRRAVTVWRQRVDLPDWKYHLLKEAQERIREMTEDEEARYFAALRPDYHPVMRFALLSGCRMQEILDLEWRDINWRDRSLNVTGKGDKTRAIPLSNAIEALLKPLPRADARVFTYESKRADNAPRGERRPIEREGLKITHRRTCRKAGVEDFRFHDFRHTAATRLMRATGNIKLVQRLLGHEDIATTARYSHVTENDLLAAMNATQSATMPAKPSVNAMKNNGNMV